MIGFGVALPFLVLVGAVTGLIVLVEALVRRHERADGWRQLHELHETNGVHHPGCPFCEGVPR